MNAARASDRLELFLRAEYLLDEVDEFRGFIHNQVGRDRVKTGSNRIDARRGSLRFAYSFYLFIRCR